jgi:hypothetical protein
MLKTPLGGTNSLYFRDLHSNILIGTASDRYAGWIGQISVCVNKKHSSRKGNPMANPKPLSIKASESLSLEEGLIRLRGKKQGKKTIEITSKPDLFQETQERRHIDRVIDWENIRYQEIIKGPGGKIIRQVDEPLSNHTGKGSAKRKKGKE